MNKDEVDAIMTEYFHYKSNDKHALPFVIWLKYKKRFDSHTIRKIYEVLGDG